MTPDFGILPKNRTLRQNRSISSSIPLLTQAQTQGLLKARGRQRTDSTHVLAAIRVLNRLERVGKTLRAALNSVAVVAPAWVQALAPNEWYDRYSRRVENYHLPKTDTARQALATVIGADGQTLLTAIDAAVDQPWLRQVPARPDPPTGLGLSNTPMSMAPFAGGR